MAVGGLVSKQREDVARCWLAAVAEMKPSGKIIPWCEVYVGKATAPPITGHKDKIWHLTNELSALGPLQQGWLR